jgi:hypothetical protein
MMKSEGYHLDILYKEHLEKLWVINAAPTFNTHLHRLESLCHQPCAGHAQQLGGESPLPNLMEVKG